VNRNSSTFYRLGVVTLLGATLVLSACGRKGALDAPPGGAAVTAGTDESDAADEAGKVVRPGTKRGVPLIQGPDRRIPLDNLLN